MSFISFCFIHVRMVISQNGIIAPVGLELVESELGNAECANKPWKNNGDCVANSYDEFCEESWINHDCWY